MMEVKTRNIMFWKTKAFRVEELSRPIAYVVLCMNNFNTLSSWSPCSRPIHVWKHCRSKRHKLFTLMNLKNFSDVNITVSVYLNVYSYYINAMGKTINLEYSP